MLSIKDILEENGFEIEIHKPSMMYEGLKNVTITSERKCKRIYSTINIKKEESIECACREYIKDNGFKLEWIVKELEKDFKVEIKDCGKKITSLIVGLKITYSFEADDEEHNTLTYSNCFFIENNKITHPEITSYNAQNAMKLIAYLFANDIKLYMEGIKW